MSKTAHSNGNYFLTFGNGAGVSASDIEKNGRTEENMFSKPEDRLREARQPAVAFAPADCAGFLFFRRAA